MSEELYSSTQDTARFALTASVLSIAGTIYIMVDTLRVHGSCKRVCSCSPTDRTRSKRRISRWKFARAPPRPLSQGSAGNGFLPVTESYQPRILGNNGGLSDITVSTGTGESGIASSTESNLSAASEVNFVKQRHFLDKSGPFLLFNLNISVLILSTMFFISAILVLARSGRSNEYFRVRRAAAQPHYLHDARPHWCRNERDCAHSDACRCCC